MGRRAEVSGIAAGSIPSPLKCRHHKGLWAFSERLGLETNPSSAYIIFVVGPLRKGFDTIGQRAYIPRPAHDASSNALARRLFFDIVNWKGCVGGACGGFRAVVCEVYADHA